MTAGRSENFAAFVEAYNNQYTHLSNDKNIMQTLSNYFIQQGLEQGMDQGLQQGIMRTAKAMLKQG